MQRMSFFNSRGRFLKSLLSEQEDKYTEVVMERKAVLEKQRQALYEDQFAVASGK